MSRFPCNYQQTLWFQPFFLGWCDFWIWSIHSRFLIPSFQPANSPTPSTGDAAPEGGRATAVHRGGKRNSLGVVGGQFRWPLENPQLPFGCGSKPMVPFWGRCTTHFRTYFSGDWDVHRESRLLSSVDPILITLCLLIGAGCPFLGLVGNQTTFGGVPTHMGVNIIFLTGIQNGLIARISSPCLLFFFFAFFWVLLFSANQAKKAYFFAVRFFQPT